MEVDQSFRTTRFETARHGSTRLDTPEDGLRRNGTPEDGRDDFTSEELDLLGSKGIVRSPQGEWFHAEKYPDGRTMITPARAERIENYSRLFAFTQEGDIDVADFAAKTNIEVKSVTAMIGHAKNTRSVYEQMRGAGFTD